MPRSFIILLIIGGLVVVFTSPVGTILQQWLGNATSIEEKAYNSAILLSASLMAGLQVILLEVPIVGNAGLYYKVGSHLHKKSKYPKPEGKDIQPENFDFLTKVSFYGWLNENGCSRFLEHLNLQNTIVNALLTGFTISFLLNLFGLPVALLLNYLADWYSFDLNLYLIALFGTLVIMTGLWQYNRVWRANRRSTLIGVDKEYHDEMMERKNKQAPSNFHQDSNG